MEEMTYKGILLKLQHCTHDYAGVRPSLKCLGKL